MAISNVQNLHAVLGGFDLGSASIGHTVDELKVLKPNVVVPMHCSGANFIAAMQRRTPDRVVTLNVGTTFTFGV